MTDRIKVVLNLHHVTSNFHLLNFAVLIALQIIGIISIVQEENCNQTDPFHQIINSGTQQAQKQTERKIEEQPHFSSLEHY